MSTLPPGNYRQIHTPSELGNVISELRSSRRKTQFEVASALAIDRSQLAHLEGGRSGRYLAHLLNILDHLGAELQIHWPTDIPITAVAPELGTSSESASSASLLKGLSPLAAVQKPSLTTKPLAHTATDLEPSNLRPLASYEPASGEPSTFTVDLEPSNPLPDTSTEPASVEASSPSNAEEQPNEVNEVIGTAEEASPAESASAQLTKITNQAMNVMAASQQLSVKPRPHP
jgi:transcriptional regulator with XRE-family HTH domain